MDKSKFHLNLNEEKSVSDRVAEALRYAIITRNLEGGERLVEAKIAKELNVSITPVRHAFTELSKEGLIEVFPFRGTYVFKPTEAFILDLKMVRKNLEGKAADLCFEHITKEDCKLLEEYYQKSNDLFFMEGNAYDSILFDMKFHSLFFEKSNSPILMELWDTIKYRVQLLQAYAKGHQSSENMLSRHKLILDALYAKDKEAFVKAAIAHVETSSIYLPDSIKDKPILNITPLGNK